MYRPVRVGEICEGGQMKSVPATLFFKVMKEEPHLIPFCGIGNLIDAGKPPYRPGEKCYVREGWRLDNGVIVYKSDCIPSFRKYHAWKSSVIMPAKYARRFVTILSCEPVRKEDGTWAWRVISQPSGITG